LRGRWSFWLATVSAFSLVLFIRLWGIGYAPATPLARPDEQVFITRALEAFASSGMKSAPILFSGFPEGFFRIVHILQWLEARFLSALWGKPVNLGCLYALNPGALEILPRLLSVAGDLLSAVLVGAMVHRLWKRFAEARSLPTVAPWSFTLGALAFGGNYLAARDAHFASSDSILLLCVCGCLYACMRAVLDDPMFLVLAGAAAGAGFGIKYSAAFLAVTCAVAGGACLVRGRARWGRVLVSGLLAVAAALLCFALLSPGVFGHFGEFASGLLGHRGERYGARGRMFLLDKNWVGPSGWSLYLLDILPTAFGWPGFFLGLGGFALALLSDAAVGLILLSSAVAAIAMVAPATALFARYAAPAVPPLSVGLGLALCASFAFAARWPRGKYAVGLLFVVVGLAPPIWRSVQLDRLMATTDTREVAGRYVASQGPGVTAIAEGWFAQTYLLDEASAAACAAEIPNRLNLGIPVMASAGSRWPAAIALGEQGWGAIANDAGEAYIYRPPPVLKADYVLDGFGPCPAEGTRAKKPTASIPIASSSST
jgi:hypothetical protein